MRTMALNGAYPSRPLVWGQVGPPRVSLLRRHALELLTMRQNALRMLATVAALASMSGVAWGDLAPALPGAPELSADGASGGVLLITSLLFILTDRWSRSRRKTRL